MIRIVAFLALVCAIGPLGAGTTRVDFDHNRQFFGYKTYSWVQSAPGQSSNILFPNQIMSERIAGFIEEALAAKGLRHVQSGGDLLISYHVNVAELPTYTTFNDTTGWGWGWGSGISTTTTNMIYEGTLVVDLTDAHQNQLVFQGVSRNTISSRPARNTRRLSNAVREIFEKYPPAQ